MRTLLDNFRTPPQEYGPVPFYWWAGDRLNRKRLAWQLDQLSAQGVHQTIISYPHNLDNSTMKGDPPLFSTTWWNLFRWFVAACRRRKMTVGFQDYTIVGPVLESIGRSTPDMQGGQMGAIAHLCNGPDEVNLTSETGSLVVGAWAYPVIDQIPDGIHAIDLSEMIKDGTLKWKAPSGTWLVAMVFARLTPFDPLHHQSGQLAIEKLYEPFERECPGEVGKTLKIFFQDELDFGSRMPFWSNRLFTAFSQRFGYDLRPWLPALWYDLGSKTEKIRLDYHDAVVSGMEESYFKPIFAWHETRGTLFGNDNHGRGNIGAGRQFYGDYFRTMRWYSAPGTDDPTIEGARNFKGLKLNSSIAHLYRRKRVWNEAFHSSGWGVKPADLLGALAEDFVCGATVVNLHGLYYSTRGSWWEWASPDFHFRQPYWQNCQSLNQSLTRLCWLLSQGVHRCDVAIVYPSAALEAASYADAAAPTGWPNPEQVTSELGRFLFDHSCDFDFIDFESLERADCQEGALAISGESYKALILPAMNAVRMSTLEKMREFIEEGGLVMAYGCLPTASESAGREDSKLQTLIDELFELNHNSDCPISIKTHPSGGKGIYIRNGFTELLKTLTDLIRRDVVASAVPLHVLHRSIEKHDLFFVFNPSSNSLNCDVQFRKIGSIEEWNVHTGESTTITPLDQDGEITVLRLNLAAREGRVVVFNRITKNNAQSPSKSLQSNEASEILPLSDDWNFSLLPSLDNHFGDFRLPATKGCLGPEVRRFLWAEEFESEIDWHHATFDDSAWPETTFSFGERFQSLGPLPPASDFVGLERDLLAQKLNNGAWRPYEFSLRWGIEHDPFLTDRLSGPHGLKNRIPDEFLDFYHPVPGTVWYLSAKVFAREDATVPFVMGGRCAYEAWINNRSVLRQPEALPPGHYPPWDLPHYDSPPLKTSIFLHRGLNNLLLKLIQPAGQRTRAYCAFQPPSTNPKLMALRWFTDSKTPRPASPAPSNRKSVWLRFLAPPGMREMNFVARGPVCVWSDGNRCDVFQLESRIDGSMSFRAIVLEPRPGPVKVAIRVEAPLEFNSGDTLPEPIQFICGPGKIPLGDWCHQGLAVYSGRAKYQNIFDLRDPSAGEKIILDLGDVAATAEVRVNERFATELIGPPWEVDITEFVRTGPNEIAVIIANTLANHYSVGIPSPYVIQSQNRSGLFGPVRLLSVL